MKNGARIGHYEIHSSIGTGGMGEVYRARDTRLDREVAIKVLPAEVSSDPDRLKRFEQEARATSALNHPNILTVYDIGTSNGSPYIVAELLEGDELPRSSGPGTGSVCSCSELGSREEMKGLDGFFSFFVLSC